MGRYKQGGVSYSSFLYILKLGIVLISLFIYSREGNFDNHIDYWYSYLLFIVGGLLLLSHGFLKKLGFTIITGCVVSLFLGGLI